MAQLALSVAGAAIGSMFGMPQLGWAVGSMIGASIAAPRLQGPRVEDLSVQISSYGQPVPKVYGSDRVGCTPIWSAGLVETANKQGGKGGPKVTTYSYSLSFAVLIAEGRIRGIRRMWADALLIYDARDDATDEVKAESARNRTYWTWYGGTESQSPDPTIEAAEGAGNVPAMRGTAYIVFTNYPLDKHGNRMPAISVEVNSEIDETAVDPADGTEREPLRVYPWGFDGDGMPVHSLGETDFTWGTQPLLFSSTNFTTIAEAQASEFFGDGSNHRPEAGRFSTRFPGPGYWATKNNTTLALISGGATLAEDPEFVIVRASAYPPEYVVRTDYSNTDPQMPNLPLLTHTLIVDPPPVVDVFDEMRMGWKYIDGGAGGPHPLGYTYVAYASEPIVGSVPPSVWITIISYLLKVNAKRIPYHPPKTCQAGNPCTAPEGSAEVQGNPDFCVTCDGTIIPNRTWVTATGTAKQLTAVEYRGNVLYQNALGPVLLPADPNYSDSTYWDAQAAAAKAAGLMQPDAAYPAVVTEWAESTGSDATAYEVPPATNTTITLGDIVSHICTTAGLTAGQIDVTELTQDVIGFTRTNRMAARSALEPLRLAFHFDAVESGDKIVFKTRGRATTATITSDDLAAGVDQPQQVVMEHERSQEAELPDVVTVTYKALSQDYQPGVQEARRRAGESDQQATIEVPVVLTDDQARQVAYVLLYTAWQGRTTRTLSTTMTFAAVEPTDVIEVNDDDL
jgi:hypothetical protein